MTNYTYKLYKNKEKESKQTRRYDREELSHLTTHHLREICLQEKIIRSLMNPLDKEELIRLIIRFRGKDETYLIREHVPEGFKRIEEYLKACSSEPYDHGTPIRNPAKILIYDHVEVNPFDEIIISNCDFLDTNTNVLLMNDEGRLCTIFNLVNIEDTYYLTKSSDVDGRTTGTSKYSLIYLGKEESKIIYDLYTGSIPHEPSHFRYYRYSIMDFDISTVEETNNPLAIDFGTSNTTAGICVKPERISEEENLLDTEIHYVMVRDTTSDTYEKTPIIPSAIAVSKIQGEQIEYVYGYEAIRLSRLSQVDEGFSVFYDIKRWLSDLDGVEEVVDVTGNRCYVNRHDMLCAYLHYILQLATQRFKTKFSYLHISCPVKQKHSFGQILTELLPDYTIETTHMLDEGAAVLFNTLWRIIEKGAYDEEHTYKALIIDCGGGTTDLSSCQFNIVNKRISYGIHMSTSYENGNVDFGGNNITYRIMQYLKICMVLNMRHDDKGTREQVLRAFRGDAYRYIDEHGIEALYEDFCQVYETMEAILPTRFLEYEDKSKQDYYKVKKNFFYLFQLAEKVKKAFFETMGTLEVCLTHEPIRIQEYTISIPLEKWAISRIDANQSLYTMKEMDKVYINMQDIRLLIKGDIYHVISDFLGNLYEEDLLAEYDIIKLTGQSCKIDLFREAIKEYIPGKQLQFHDRGKGEGKDYTLKLACLDGVLKYLYAKRLGYVDLHITSDIKSLPYYIVAYTHRGDEKNLIDSVVGGAGAGFISRRMQHIMLKLYLKDMNQRTRHIYEYECRQEDFEEVLYEHIDESYRHYILQDETDRIINDEVKFFVWAKTNQWGFYVLPILRKDEKIHQGKLKFFSFENSVWELNLYDGLK